jgi:undecaprenyl diphosphate synthase
MKQKQIPKHVAIIMDGNSTWAERNGKSSLDGYYVGMKNMSNIILALNDADIKFSTFYAFSSENWKRPPKWIADFMDLALKFLKLDESVKNVLAIKPRIVAIGDLSKLRPDVRNILAEYTEKTKDNLGLVVCIAISYGGRDEIVRAARKLVASGREITEQTISDNLDVNIPDPDLIIRTGGKQRLSNFLLWQASYSELYFSRLCWPEFTKDDLVEAISEFGKIERTYGA